MSITRNTHSKPSIPPDDFDKEFFGNVGENFEIAEEFFKRIDYPALPPIHSIITKLRINSIVHLQPPLTIQPPEKLTNTKKRSLTQKEQIEILDKKITEQRFQIARGKKELHCTVLASKKALSEKTKAEEELKMLRSQISILSTPYCAKCNELK